MKNNRTWTALLILLPMAAMASSNNSMSTGLSTNCVAPADWGPAYVPGIEHGPKSKVHSIAMGKAQAFMAKQKFANQYAKRACAIGGRNMEVHFALLEDKTGQTHGIVRVNMSTGECTWLGNNKSYPEKSMPIQASEAIAPQGGAQPQR